LLTQQASHKPKKAHLQTTRQEITACQISIKALSGAIFFERIPEKKNPADFT
jgi:hypothetical protein